MTTKTVDIIGSGELQDPYRPDYDGDYQNAQFDFENGTVTIDTE